jgi:hypothetical protein
VNAGGITTQLFSATREWSCDALSEMRTSVRKISIPVGVTTIGCGAFNACHDLIEVDVPSGVASLGSAAFNCCSALVRITLPSTLETIGHGAFFGCSALRELAIPSSVTSVGSCAFSRSGLEKVQLPEGCVELGFSAFECCQNLWAAVLPRSVDYLDDFVFEDCVSLRPLMLRPDMLSMGRNAFRGVTNVELVILNGPSVSRELVAALDRSLAAGCRVTGTWPPITGQRFGRFIVNG